MARSLLLFLLFALTVPAFAKPRHAKQPVSCRDLWTAVTETLGNAGNYTIAAINNEEMKANFSVVGALFPQMNMVRLKPRETGCDLQLRIGFTGNDDDGAFRSRVSRSLKKVNAAKAAAPSGAGQAQ